MDVCIAVHAVAPHVVMLSCVVPLDVWQNVLIAFGYDIAYKQWNMIILHAVEYKSIISNDTSEYSKIVFYLVWLRHIW